MDMNKLIENVLESYATIGGINSAGINSFPNRENVVAVLKDLQCLIFPGYTTAEEFDEFNLRYITGQRINRIVSVLTKEIQKALMYEVSVHSENNQNGEIKNSHCFQLAEKTALAVIEAMPELRKTIFLDVQALFEGDPAAKSDEEVIVSYPGLEAIVTYRISHFLFTCGVPVIPRIMTEYSHSKTGIDIHPGATIGETTVIGKNVKIYQGVTLGALSVKKNLQDKKRHPTIEDNVTIYANATILGGATVIGNGAVIGGNTWITKSVPAGTVINQ